MVEGGHMKPNTQKPPGSRAKSRHAFFFKFGELFEARASGWGIAGLITFVVVVVAYLILAH